MVSLLLPLFLVALLLPLFRQLGVTSIIGFIFSTFILSKSKIKHAKNTHIYGTLSFYKSNLKQYEKITIYPVDQYQLKDYNRRR